MNHYIRKISLSSIFFILLYLFSPMRSVFPLRELQKEVLTSRKISGLVARIWRNSSSRSKKLGTGLANHLRKNQLHRNLSPDNFASTRSNRSHFEVQITLNHK